MGQVYDDSIRRFGFRAGLCVSCGVLRLRLSRLDGWIQMVGYRSIQTGKAVILVPSPSSLLRRMLVYLVWTMLT